MIYRSHPQILFFEWLPAAGQRQGLRPRMAVPKKTESEDEKVQISKYSRYVMNCLIGEMGITNKKLQGAFLLCVNSFFLYFDFGRKAGL